MSEDRKEKEVSENQNAKEIAEAMAANMKANMEDPEFWENKERIQDDVRKKVLEKRRLRKLKEEQEKK